MNYLEQVKRALDYIEDHLHEDLALVEISQVAGVSHWHFLRMFKALTNETLKAYIRSRRLAEARLELLTTQDDVLTIALRAGFGSQASFTRAFRAIFGMPPGQYRALGSEHVHIHKLPMDEEYIRHVHDHITLEPRIEVRKDRHFVGLATRYYSVASDRNNIAQTLPGLWDGFMGRLEEVQGLSDRRVCFGIIQQAPGEEELLEYTAAVEVEEPPGDVMPDGMVYRCVPASAYAVFTHCGRAEMLDQTVNYIYASWLMRSGHRHSYGPDLERYDERWRANSEESILEYGIPLVLSGS